MGITRVAKVMPPEIDLRMPIVREKHPALYEFLLTNVGPARTSFIRDTLEAALTGRLVPSHQVQAIARVAPAETTAAAPMADTVSPAPSVAPPQEVRDPDKDRITRALLNLEHS